MATILKLNLHANGTLQLASIVDDKDTGPATVLMTTGVIVVIVVVSAVTYRLGVVIPHAVLIHQAVVAVEVLHPHDLDRALVIALGADGVLVHLDLIHGLALVVVEVPVVRARALVLVLVLAPILVLVKILLQIAVERTVVASHPIVLLALRTKRLVLDQLHPLVQLSPKPVIRIVRAVASPVRVVKVKEVVLLAVAIRLIVAVKAKVAVAKATVVMVILVRVKA